MPQIQRPSSTPVDDRARPERAEMEEIAARDAVRQRLEKREATPSDIDELLDEIDQVLEENAEEVLASYLQRGGQ